MLCLCVCIIGENFRRSSGELSDQILVCERLNIKVGPHFLQNCAEKVDVDGIIIPQDYGWNVTFIPLLLCKVS